MSSQTFEILCPVCRSVVPPEAPGCPTCAERKRAAAGAVSAPSGESAPATHAAQTPVAAPAGPVPDLAALSIKDYHRVVRASYHANEGLPASHGRARAYLPFALLLILLVVGAAVIFGHL
jgi:hypothetical protein